MKKIKYLLVKLYKCKIYYPLLSRKYRKQYNKDNANRLLLIGHNCDRQGAAVLLKYIAKECVKQNWYVEILVRQPGDMFKDYAEIAKTICFCGTKDFEKKINIYEKRKFKNSLCNSTVNGDYVRILKKHGFIVESLVHELPQAIKELKAEDRARDIAKYSDIVVFPSSFVYDKFAQYGIPNKKMIMPQGLYLTDSHIVDYNNSNKILEKHHIGLKNKKLVINVATGEKRKGFDIFLNTANNLKEYKDILFVWVGDYNKQIVEEILGNEQPDNLVLFGYINNPELLACFYDCADVLLLTSREEPFGSIVLEAFHASTPVIGFENAGGFVDTVIPGVTGELVEYENTVLLGQALVELINDKKRLREYGKNCMVAAKKYKFDNYVKVLMEIFNG